MYTTKTQPVIMVRNDIKLGSESKSVKFGFGTERLIHDTYFLTVNVST